jgi:hypothetical protein
MAASTGILESRRDNESPKSSSSAALLHLHTTRFLLLHGKRLRPPRQYCIDRHDDIYGRNFAVPLPLVSSKLLFSIPWCRYQMPKDTTRLDPYATVDTALRPVNAPHNGNVKRNGRQLPIVFHGSNTVIPLLRQQYQTR